jgi:hypothetical protein
MIKRKLKNMRGFSDAESIRAHYTTRYGFNDTSRYKHIDELLLEDGKLIKSTLGLVDLGVYPFDGISTHIVSAAEENRLDIIATKYYGSASMYWVLCYANVMSDPYDLPIGKSLIIPNKEALWKFPNPLS